MRLKVIARVGLAGMLLLGVSALATAAQDVPRIPLRVGLTIVTAIHGSNGDYESIKTIISQDAKSWRIKYSSEASLDNDLLDEESQYVKYRPDPQDPNKVICTTTVYRNVLRADLQSSDHYLRIFSPPPQMAETIPGTTAIGTSARLLTAFKTKGTADFTTYLTATWMGVDTFATADPPGGYDITNSRFGGPLNRVGKGTVGVPVIVNGKLVTLPTIYVKGDLLDTNAEFWFLDDPDNPLALRYIFDKDHLDVIRINFPGDTTMTAGPDAGGSGLEQSLEKSGRADVYGIYFGFNSDVIRAESEPVLKEIAALLLKHPDWSLDVGGHTDNVGGAAFNEALSTRRAAAVKKALVERYHVAAARLATAGYGLSQPKASNETLQGRALNRRVELVKR